MYWDKDKDPIYGTDGTIIGGDSFVEMESGEIDVGNTDIGKTNTGGTNTESTDAGFQVTAEDINATGGKLGGESKSETFSTAPFDFFGSPLFQMYQSMYMGNAQKAMKGAIADSALLTGGYGNSFGQVAGQQAYADVMDDFYAAIPSLFSAAYSVYDSERAAAKAAWDENQAKIAEATEKAQGEYDAAVDSEQDRAYDYALEKIESGKWTWEQAEEALRGLTYTDHEGKEVSLFTEEDVKGYSDLYDYSVATKEAANNAFDLELIEMLIEHPEYATEEYLTAYFKDKGYVPDEGVIKSYVDNYQGRVEEDTEETPQEYKDLAWSYIQNGEQNKLDALKEKLQGDNYDTNFIDYMMLQHKADSSVKFNTGNEELDKVLNRDYTIKTDTKNRGGKNSLDRNDVWTYTDDKGKEVTVKIADLFGELKDLGMKGSAAREWIMKNLGAGAQ